MVIEVTAKKVDDAIKQGLEQLGASLDEVRVEVLESGGLFRKAKVRLTLEKEQEPEQPQQKTADDTVVAPKKQPTEKTKPEQKQKSAGSRDEQAHTQSAHGDGGVTPKEKTKPTEAKQPKPQKSEQQKTKPAAAPKPVAKTQKASAARAGDNADGETARPAKNSAEYKAALDQAVEFVKTVLEKMGFTDLTVVADENGDIAVTAPAGDDSLIIGRHGETLSALSFLAETLGRAEKHHINIVVDCNGYRARRAESLSAMAHRKANECASKHRKIKLEPMERVDRRTIHNALTDDDRVITSSEGKEPYRCVVILPKNN